MVGEWEILGSSARSPSAAVVQSERSEKLMSFREFAIAHRESFYRTHIILPFHHSAEDGASRMM
jgi:hypothetical protein